MKTVIVVDYDPRWPAVFERLRASLARALAGLPFEIEHVGSTSVPGLAAKPVIDLNVVVPTANEVAETIERLASLGYRHRGDLGIVGREAFRAPPGLPKHHLYVCVEGVLALRNHLGVRDYLRTHPEAVRAELREGRRREPALTAFDQVRCGAHVGLW